MAAFLTAPGMAGATDNPDDLSAANQALFIKPHLDSIKEPAVLAEIERDGFRVLDRRTALTPLRKLWIAWKTWVGT